MTFLFFILALLAAILSFFYYRKTNPPISTTWKWILGIARFLFFLIILLLITTPIIHFIKKRKVEPNIAIASDISASMNQKLFNDKTKATIGKDYINRIIDFLKKNNFRTSQYNFSKGLTEDTVTTDILLSLEQILKKEKNNNLSEIVLISDGLNHNNNNYFLLEEINIPVFPVILGKNPEPFDISIEDIQTNNPVYQNTETDINVTLKSSEKEQQVDIILLKDNKEIIKKRFELLENTDEIIIPYKPKSLGFQKMKVIVELPGKNEINKTNNQREFLLNVVKDKANIALITSNLNWDATFIHRALKKNDKFEVNLIVKRNSEFFLDNKQVYLINILDDCDILILNSVSEFNFNPNIYELIKKILKKGVNILYVGKIEPKLADLLPLTITKYRDVINTNIRLTNQADNYRTFYINQNTENIHDFWQNLPPIKTYFYKSRSNTEIIAESTTKTKNPVIAFSNYYQGHILMFAGYDFFRWKMWEKKNQWFDNFIISLINWLINTDISKRFVCTPNKLHFFEGETINFSSMLFDEKMNIIPRQDILLKVDDGKNVIEKFFNEQVTKYTLDIENLPANKYTYHAETTVGNQIYETEGEFLVEATTLEKTTNGINNTFLNFIASQTEGGIIKGESDFKNLLDINKAKKTIESIHELELWKKWYMPVIAILLFTLELFFRKKKGLL